MTGASINDTIVNVRGGFTAAAAGPGASGKCSRASSSVTFRVSAEERSQLEADACGLSLSAYVRERLFGDDAPKRRVSGKAPIKDHAALAQVLSALGRSRIARDLETLEWAERDGVLHLDPSTASALRQATADIAAMRQDLVRALGLRAPRRR